MPVDQVASGNNPDALPSTEQAGQAQTDAVKNGEAETGRQQQQQQQSEELRVAPQPKSTAATAVPPEGAPASKKQKFILSFSDDDE
eukprot:scaffold268588_cov15-Tisochrysis_lutea.AAC.1